MKIRSKKYFQDYEIREIEDQEGKIKRELVYIGNTYCVSMTEKKYRRKKLLSAWTSVCCMALFLLANLQDTQSNIEGALPAFGVIAVIPLFVLCCGCVCGLWKKKIMTRADYAETSMMVKFGGFFTAALAGLNFVWHGIFLVKTASSQDMGKEAAVAAFWLAMLGLSLGLWIAEMRTEYVIRNRYGAVIHQEHWKRRETE